jgi:Tfp pilus assembly PilM family ATPase
MIGIASRTPIGIDLGRRQIKAAQLNRLRQGWRLSAAAVMDLQTINKSIDASDIRRLRDVFDRNGFVGNDVVLSAPSAGLAVEVLELPPRASGAPLDQIARMEMARAGRFEQAGFEMDYWDLPTPARGSATTSVMAMALRHSDAESILAPFEEEGFNVIAIDSIGWSLSRAGAPHFAGGCSAVLDIGWTRALVGLVFNGGLVYQRHLPDAGLASLHEQLSSQFKLDSLETDYVARHVGASECLPEEFKELPRISRIRDLITRHLDAMTEPLITAFQYAEHRYADGAVKRLLLAGDGTELAGIEQRLEQNLKIPTSALAAGKLVECPAAMEQHATRAQLAAAIGLAMHRQQ